MPQYRDEGRWDVPPPVTPGTRLISTPDGPPRRPPDRQPYRHRRPVDHRRRQRERRRRVFVALGAVVLFLAGVGAYLLIGDDGERSALGGDVEPQAPAAEPTTTTPAEGDQVASSALTVAPTAAAPVPPYVAATFDGKNLTLSGAVADSGLVEQLDQTTQLIYGPFVSSDIGLDPQLDSPEWLTASPQAVAMLQTISSGSLVLSEGRFTVSGQAASAEDAATLESYLTATGLPVDIGGVKITDLREAVYVIAGSDGSIALSGALPNEEIRTGLANAAAAVYGPDNVFDASTVDPTVTSALWMHTPDALIATLAAFPTFEVRLDGPDFTASLSGGSVFGSNSIEIGPEFAQVLNFGIVVLARDPSMTIDIEGHTDSDGDAAYNLELSQQRADAVAAYFAAAGIDPSRITAVGRGEESPAAPNDTPEGRALNRRVEFSLQSVD